jgi:hypothetical protein
MGGQVTRDFHRSVFSPAMQRHRYVMGWSGNRPKLNIDRLSLVR